MRLQLCQSVWLPTNEIERTKWFYLAITSLTQGDWKKAKKKNKNKKNNKGLGAFQFNHLRLFWVTKLTICCSFAYFCLTSLVGGSVAEWFDSSPLELTNDISLSLNRNRQLQPHDVIHLKGTLRVPQLLT